MENYQTAGVFISVIGLFLGLIVAFSFTPLAWVGGVMLLVNFFTLMLSVMQVKPWNYGFTVGLLGLFGNIFLLIPAFMAYGYKKKQEAATTTAKGSDFQLNNRDLSIGFAAIALVAIPLYFLTETVAELTVTVLELPAIEEDHKQEVIAVGTEEMERSDNLQKYGWRRSDGNSRLGELS